MKFLNVCELSILWACSIDSPTVSGRLEDRNSLVQRGLITVHPKEFGKEEVLITPLGLLALRAQEALRVV